ncbi:MAG TPA: hypothetical protein ENI23_05760 [bacterium]|nr:hypothetical protein [bacterium]
MKKYNHAFDIAFSIESDNDRENVTEKELLNALLKKVEELKADPKLIIECASLPFDTYENE